VAEANKKATKEGVKNKSVVQEVKAESEVKE